MMDGKERKGTGRTSHLPSVLDQPSQINRHAPRSLSLLLIVPVLLRVLVFEGCILQPSFLPSPSEDLGELVFVRWALVGGEGGRGGLRCGLGRGDEGHLDGVCCWVRV